MPIFTEIAVIVVIAVAAGFIAHLLRQPPIIGFIAAGALVGFFEYLEGVNLDFIEGLSSIGVALLLFLVGLEMDFRELKHVTLPAFFIGLGQIIMTFGVGFLIASALGFSTISSFYIALALTFSSTIIVVKLLSEKESLTSLHGRIVLGILLVQDIVAILAIIFIAGIHGGSTEVALLDTLIKGGGLMLLTFVAYRVLPRILDMIGRSQEMLYLFGIAWALGIAALSAKANLSIEVGGFLAGLALASSSEHFEIAARLRPLRDFFIILFFIALGIKAFEGGIAVEFLPALAFTTFVLIGNPLLVMLIMGLLGYRGRTSFLAGSSIAQISEFGLIVIALGARMGDIGSSEVSLVTIVGVLTIFTSSYFIVHQEKIYEFLRPFAKRFEFRKKLIEEIPPETELSDHIVLIGVHRMGEQILRALSNSTASFIALDFDPVVVKTLCEVSIPVIYGDIEDMEIRKKAGINRARVVISTVPDFKENLGILTSMKLENKKAKLVLTAENEWQAKELYRRGADYVLVPHFLGGRELTEVISEDSALSQLAGLKKRDLKILDRYSS